MQTTSLSRAIRWFCYFGAIVDLGAAVQMLSPKIFAHMYGLDDFTPGPDHRFAMKMGASLMLGWSVLLLWAARRPLERSGVLVITVVPVVAGLAVNEIMGIASGFVKASAVLPVLALQALLSGVAIALALARRAKPVAR